MPEDRTDSADNELKDETQTMEVAEPIQSHEEKDPEVQIGLGKAIASMFCFFPVGIMAIWFAGKAKDQVDAGDTERAESLAGTSRFLIKASVLMAPVWIIGLIVLKLILSKSAE